jgi:cytochrome c oxidase subunit IV
MSEIQVETAETEIQEIHQEHVQAHAGHPSAKEYVRIFLILIAITGIEVALYYVREDLGPWFIPTLFLLAFSKFALVVLWFMHLKFDSKRYSRFFVMGLAGALTLYSIVLISFRVFLR